MRLGGLWLVLHQHVQAAPTQTVSGCRNILPLLSLHDTFTGSLGGGFQYSTLSVLIYCSRCYTCSDVGERLPDHTLLLCSSGSTTMTGALSVQRRVVGSPSPEQSTSRVTVSPIWARSPSSATQRVGASKRHRVTTSPTPPVMTFVAFVLPQAAMLSSQRAAASTSTPRSTSRTPAP